jgi:2'-5' RNA ligase
VYIRVVWDEVSDEDDVLFGRAWETFGGLSHPAQHRVDWGAWAANHDFHLLVLVPIESAETRACARQVQDSLGHLPGVELHPAEFLHITIQSLGFLDRADPIASLVAALEKQIARVNAFDVRLGGLNALHSCAFLEVRPSTGLSALRTAVRRAVGDAIHEIDPYPDYLFHLTVGYFGAGASIDSLVAAIEPLRDHSAGTLHVNAVDLVALPTDQVQPFPPLEPLARFTLASNRRTRI